MLKILKSFTMNVHPPFHGYTTGLIVYRDLKWSEKIAFIFLVILDILKFLVFLESNVQCLRKYIVHYFFRKHINFKRLDKNLL